MITEKRWCELNKIDPDSIKPCWNKLIDYAVKTHNQKSFNVKLPLRINDEIWTAHGAEVCYREISFFCKEGTVNYVIDSYGEKSFAVLFDWEINN